MNPKFKMILSKKKIKTPQNYWTTVEQSELMKKFDDERIAKLGLMLWGDVKPTINNK